MRRLFGPYPHFPAEDDAGLPGSVEKLFRARRLTPDSIERTLLGTPEYEDVPARLRG